MKEKQTRFAFSCPYPAEQLRERLPEQVKMLTKREYLVKWTERGFDLGIGRGGHSGGYWYSATVEKTAEGCVIRGDVEYRTWHGKEVGIMWKDKLLAANILVIFSPVILIMLIYRCSRPEITMKDHFVAFMTGPMGCDTI